MNKQHSATKLTGKESEVVDVFLNADGPLTASEIQRLNPSLNIHTTQNVLRSLLKREYIEVADIVYSGTALCRSYKSTDLLRKMSSKSLAEQFAILRKSIPVSTLLAAMMERSAVDGEQLMLAFETVIKAVHAGIEPFIALRQ